MNTAQLLMFGLVSVMADIAQKSEIEQRQKS